MLAPLPSEHDTLLFCRPQDAATVIAALEDGFDQIVALCVSSEPFNDSPETTSAALGFVDQAGRLDLPLFADTRFMTDLAFEGFRQFSGAVCLANQVKFLRKTLGSETTLVVDAGISRHEAITGAEAGADAVLFRQRAGQRATDLYSEDDEGPQDVPSLYAWWEQLMEPPAILDLDSLTATPEWIQHVEFVALQATLASPRVGKDSDG